jgi:hypothetical protein
LKRSSPEAGLVPAGQGAEGALAPAATGGLPQRLERALARELGPGEQVDFVARPAPLSRARVVLQILPCTAVFCLIWFQLLAGVGRGVSVWLVSAAAGAAGILNPVARLQVRRDTAFVLTDRRCFRLALTGSAVGVTELRELPADAGLAPADARRRRRALNLRDSRVRRSGLAPEAVLPADLPEEALARVRGALKQRERLLWIDRPRPWSCFANAPVDALTVLSFVCSAGVLVAAGFFPGAAPARAAAGLLAGWTLWRHWQKNQGTLYALTDQRGLVLVPGRRPQKISLRSLRTAVRTEDASGRGSLTPTEGGGVGFQGIANVRRVEDLLKGRPSPDRHPDLVPAEAGPGRGTELAAPSHSSDEGGSSSRSAPRISG